LKIAITADLHLSTRQLHPERYHALENILQKMKSDDITSIIIAGDLFDEFSRNYSEFDRLCNKLQYRGITFHIIPGNHDVRLNNNLFTSDNIKIYTEPTLKTFHLTDLSFLFLPFKKDKTMGEEIAALAPQLPPNEWVLIGHGDWGEGIYEANPLEPGVYMPLTRVDIESYKPVRVVIGHIHKSKDWGNIHYPGSPCPLDITETGRRRFLVIDTETSAVKPKTVDSDILFINESFVILPLDDERTYLKAQIDSRLNSFGFSETEKSKLRVRVKVKGYTSNKRELMKILKECLKDFTFYQNQEPDLTEVFVSDDVEREEIAHRVSQSLRELEWTQSDEEPEKDQILLHALHAIYGD
jgi:exonuclease SbcD